MSGRTFGLPDAPAFWGRSACAGMLDLFFGPGLDDLGEPIETKDEVQIRNREAAAVCATCPVLAECRADLLAGPVERYAVRAAMTPRGQESARRLAARGERPAPAAPAPAWSAAEPLRLFELTEVSA